MRQSRKGILLVVCMAGLACNKHKTVSTQPSNAPSAPITSTQAPSQDARVQEAQATQVPPRQQQQREMAASSGLSHYGVGGHPAGTVPGENTAPGTTRAVRPSQGTLEPAQAANAQQGDIGAASAAAGHTDRGDVEQGTSPSDRGMTQKIRRALLEDESISFTAKNVHIITRDGNVTLRGLVLSEKERKAVEGIARSYVGGGAVTNLLELKNSPSLRLPE